MKKHIARKNKHAKNDQVLLLGEDDVYLKVQNTPNIFILVLDCIQDPHNLGACLRSADAAGVDLVIIPKDKAAPVTSTVVQIACGATESLNIAKVTNLARCLEQIKKLGVFVIGTSDRAVKNIYQTDLKGSLALVMGSEHKGMRQLTEKCCDQLVFLPMKGKVECLNVSVATGITLYEAVRQRA